MAKVFIIHGAYGNPEENWIPWLKKELEAIGCTVFAPEFPTPDGQSLENWRCAFQDYCRLIDNDSILVGHSLGTAFILDILEKVEEPVVASFFVSPFIELLENPNFDSINSTFVKRGFDWEKIRNSCRKFVVFHSNNDPYVPLEKAKNVAEKLGVKVNVVKWAGHFNEKSGYNKFPALLEKIKEEI